MSERSDGSHSRLELIGWGAGAFVLAALAVPWFLWRDSTVVAGLPLWLWWHIGWMVLASIGLFGFTRHGWGVGIEATRDHAGTGEVDRDD